MRLAFSNPRAITEAVSDWFPGSNKRKPEAEDEPHDEAVVDRPLTQREIDRLNGLVVEDQGGPAVTFRPGTGSFVGDPRLIESGLSLPPGFLW